MKGKKENKEDVYLRGTSMKIECNQSSNNVMVGLMLIADSIMFVV